MDVQLPIHCLPLDVDTRDGGHINAGLVLAVNARLRDHVRHGDSLTQRTNGI